MRVANTLSEVERPGLNEGNRIHGIDDRGRCAPRDVLAACLSAGVACRGLDGLIVTSPRRLKIMDYVSTELLADPELGLHEHEEILAAGRIDSMSVMRLVSFIKDEFSISIPNEDLVLDHFKSVHALDTYLNQHGDD